MTAEQTAPPEVELIEASADRLDIKSLWRAMHEHHAEVAGSAANTPALRIGEMVIGGS